MFIARILPFATLLYLVVSSFSVSFAADWKVVRLNHPAEISANGVNWEPLGKGMIIGDKAWIRTGIRGRAMLRRDKETILYRANTQARLVQNRRSSRNTEMLQTSGRLLLDVETRPHKHTTVKTPYLSVAVKGTRFQVFVGSNRAKVSVERGIVEVTDPRRGERVDVRRGQNVTLQRRGRQQLELGGRGKQAPILDVRTGRPVATTGISLPDVRGGAGLIDDEGLASSVTGNSGRGGRGGGRSGGGVGSVSGAASGAASGVASSVSNSVSSAADSVGSLLP